MALPTLLDYRCSVPAQPGDWLTLPVGKKDYAGVVAEVLDHSPFQNLKTATPRPDVPRLHPTTLAFYRWVARYTMSAPGEALRVALPKGHIPTPPTRPPKLPAFTPEPAPVLNDAQASAVAYVRARNGPAVTLLDGVTGSGKTEVYFTLIADILAKGGQALVLVPEIALTPQWLARFRARFGAEHPTAPWPWHSGLADGARRHTWWAVAQGHSGVVVGARSALFLPFTNLQLVIVDEEHDPSYKQSEGFLYHGRDCAVRLATGWQAPCILASATPSLETWQHAQLGKYGHVTLPTRHGSAGHAPIHIIDLKAAKMAKDSYLSPALTQAVRETLAKGEQALLFLNRRGNAPLLLCTQCGHRHACSRCSTTMVVHGDMLQCHACGLREPFPDLCPSCHTTSLRTYGPGTRKVVADIQAAFPSARVAVADSDALTTPKQLAELIAQVEARTLDILVGTQMVVKGHHFPHLTCVGIVDADMGLAHGETRAAERVFQQLYQVAGRAGRAHAQGHVFLQTFSPEHPLFHALITHQRDAFYAAELDARKAWHDPPFGRQIALQLAGRDEPTVISAARTLAQSWTPHASIRLLGPAPAPTLKIRDVYRYRLLVKSETPAPLQSLVQTWIERTPLPKVIRLTVDVDPL